MDDGEKSSFSIPSNTASKLMTKLIKIEDGNVTSSNNNETITISGIGCKKFIKKAEEIARGYGFKFKVNGS